MISSALSEKIQEFLEKQINVSELEEWLVPNLPTLINIPDSADSDVVSAIELGLAELNLGIQTHESFVQLLQKVLSEHATLVAYIPTNFTSTGSSNITTPQYATHLAPATHTIIKVGP